MNKNEIKSISKGWGDGSTFFTCDPKFTGSSWFKVDKISEGRKDVGPGTILVYYGFVNDQCVFEFEANSGLEIHYFKDSEL